MTPRAGRSSCGSSTPARPTAGRRRRSPRPPSPVARSTTALSSNVAAIAEDHDDRALVRAAQEGDREALDALLRRHHDRVATICRRLAGNQADAEDATQEALIAIVRGLGRFDGRAAFTTWAHRVATNACLDELRRRGRRPTPGLPFDDAAGEGGLAPRSSPGVDAVPERLAVDAALDRLPEEFRSPVVLRDLCDLDYAEIATTLGIPPGTVRSRIARGRAQLAVLLRPSAEPGNQPPGPGRQTDRPPEHAP